MYVVFLDPSIILRHGQLFIKNVQMEIGRCFSTSQKRMRCFCASTRQKKFFMSVTHQPLDHHTYFRNFFDFLFFNLSLSSYFLSSIEKLPL